MKERPILFSAPMVRAILDGSKTQTRRVMKRQPMPSTQRVSLLERAIRSMKDAPVLRAWFQEAGANTSTELTCPYGKPGDRLWVREAVAEISCRLTYRADTDDGAHCQVKRWTPSIHMPRIWSRILLEIVSVRVERLQEISLADARAEGIEVIKERGRTGDPLYRNYCADIPDRSAIYSFQTLWRSINGTESWEANPWVWVIEFKRVTP